MLVKEIEMKISDDVLTILGQCLVDGKRLFLPDTQLDRKMYEAVNKILVAMGGKWNRSAKAHVFEECPEEALLDVLNTGEILDAKKEFQFFETPSELAQRMVALANLSREHVVLEPSAGMGAIASEIKAVHPLDRIICIELQESNVEHLRNQGFMCSSGDFLMTDISVDRIIANPPFCKGQDADHINHMLDCLAPGGRLVSIASAGLLFRQDKRYCAIRDRINALGGTIETLPAGTFKDSGTMVRTVLVVVDAK